MDISSLFDENILIAPLEAPVDFTKSKLVNKIQAKDKLSAVISKYALKSPEFISILHFPDRYGKYVSYNLLSRLIEIWLFGESKALGRPIKYNYKQGEAVDSKYSDLEYLLHLKLPTKFFENKVFTEARKEAKSKILRKIAKWGLEDITFSFSNKEIVRAHYVLLKSKLQLDSNQSGSVEGSLGDFEFLHNPQLFILSQNVGVSDYISFTPDIKTLSALGDFQINVYAQFDSSLVVSSGKEKLTLKPKRIGYRLFDSFDFRGKQFLGYWWYRETLGDKKSLYPSIPKEIIEENDAKTRIVGKYGSHPQTISLDNSTFRKFGKVFKEDYNKAKPDRALVCEDFFITTPIEDIEVPIGARNIEINDPKSI